MLINHLFPLLKIMCIACLLFDKNSPVIFWLKLETLLLTTYHHSYEHDFHIDLHITYKGRARAGKVGYERDTKEAFKIVRIK